MKRKITRRLMSVVLSVIMLFSVIPAAVFAAGPSTEPDLSRSFGRIFHLDCGRRYFTVDEIKGIIDNLAKNHFTHLQLAFANDGFRFILDDMSVGTYTSKEVSDALREANDSYSAGMGTGSGILSESDMNSVISYALDKGIQIIPMFNTPGHDNVISDALGRLGVGVGTSGRMNVTSEEQISFMKSLIKKYVDYFDGMGSRLFNFSGDEYSGLTDYTAYARYINDIAAIIKEAGMVPMAFNDGIYAKNQTTDVPFDTDILICYWSNGGNAADAKTLADKGFRIINSNCDWYYVLGDALYHVWANGQWGYEDSKKALQSVPVTQVKGDAANSVSPVGSMLCFWCDYPNYDYEPNKVYDLIETMAASNPDYFKAAPVVPDTPEKTVIDEKTGISATLKPTASEGDPVIGIRIDASYEIGEKSGTLTLDVNITENGNYYSNEALLKVPYRLWDEKLSAYGFGIGNMASFRGISGFYNFKVERDDVNGMLICHVPHFSKVNIKADLKGTKNNKVTVGPLDIGDTYNVPKISDKNFAEGGSDYSGPYVFDNPGIADVTVTGKNAETVSTEQYNQKNGLTCDNLINHDSTDWAEAKGYYYKANDGKYYPLYAKRSTERISHWAGDYNQYTYNWGYKTETGNKEAGNQVTDDQDGTIFGKHDGVNTAANINVYTKSTNNENIPASTEIVFTALAGGISKITIGDTEYTVKVRRHPVDVTVNCVCGGNTLKTVTVQAVDNMEGGYDYNTQTPKINGFKYVSGSLAGTVNGPSEIELVYVKQDFEIPDSITLPISIVDYRSDGLLFDYDYNTDSYAYSLIHSQTHPPHGDYKSGIDYGTSIPGDTLGTSIKNTKLEIRNRFSSDIYDYWSEGSRYNGGWVRTGMLEPQIGADGIPVFTHDTVYAVANLLKKDGMYNGAVLSADKNANKEFINTFLKSDSPRSVLSSETPSAMSPQFANANKYDNINNAYDLAWFLLNMIDLPDTNMVEDNGHTVPIYGMGVDTYSGLILRKSSDIDGHGTPGYVYDSAYESTYDREHGYIYNTIVAGEILTKKDQVNHRFWPIDNDGYESPELYGNTTTVVGSGHNGNFALIGSAEFIYSNDDYFYFSGDDDVYLFINGKLALDLGGAHGVCYKEINLNSLDANEYNLVPGKVATFLFYYIERCSDNSNFSMRTNIGISKPSIEIEKKAYDAVKRTEIPSGSAISSAVDVAYDFIVRNTGSANMTDIEFTDTDEFGNNVHIGKTESAVYGTGDVTLIGGGPYMVWVAETSSGNIIGEKTLYDSVSDVVVYLDTLTLEPGTELHVKGLRAHFNLAENRVFTYKNTLSVSASSSGQALTSTAVHKLYSYNISDTEKTYVVDFGLPLTIENLFSTATDTQYVKTVTIKPGLTLKYGNAKLKGDGHDSVLTYTLTRPIEDAEIITLEVKVNIDGTKLVSNKDITVIPATSVYYEDDFSDFVKFKGFGSEWTNDGTAITKKKQHADCVGCPDRNVYGYDDAYNSMSKFSLGSAKKITVSGTSYGEASFSFTGTGFDIISATTNTSGTIVVGVKNTDGTFSKNYLVDTYYGYIYDEVNGWAPAPSADKALYQIPVIKVTDLAYGKYDVKLTVAYADIFSHGQKDGASYDFWFDAVRIYDPAGAVAGMAGENQKNYDNAYKNDGEGWPVYQELRDMLIGADAFTNGAEANGMIFIDGKSGTVSMADYKNFGPKNEIYLEPGQAVAFALAASENIADIQLGLRSADGKEVTYRVYSPDDTSATDKVINTVTDMYYSIGNLAGKTVVIINKGQSGILSVTNMKTTYKEKPVVVPPVVTLRMTKSDALASLESVDGLLNPEIVFEPEKSEIKAEKKGHKTEVTVITSSDVASVVVNGNEVKDFKLNKKTGARIWKYTADEMSEVEVYVCDSDGNTSLTVTEKVQTENDIYSQLNRFLDSLLENIISALFG